MALLKKIKTFAPSDFSKRSLNGSFKSLKQELFYLQNLLFAEAKHPILIILQGMDTSGKDGTIRHVFSSVNPMGCNVKSFKAPTPYELRHDFLWRIYPHLPAKGMIQIFNRSHYEDILVPTIKKTHSKKVIEKRYDHINIFEKRLKDGGTVIMKFFLHISKEEQNRRIQSRLDNPRKIWKYDKSDSIAADSWNEYHEVYESIFSRCSKAIPWTIIPADNKWYRNYLIAKALVDKLKSLDMKFPEM